MRKSACSHRTGTNLFILDELDEAEQLQLFTHHSLIGLDLGLQLGIGIGVRVDE